MRVRVIRGALYGAGLLAMVIAVPVGLAASSVSTVPEIDGGSLTAGLGVLTAAVLILRSRSRK